MRYIDADELDKALAKECNECMHDEHDCEVCNFAIARLYVKAAPTIETEPDNGWISVENRLPEIGEHYRSKLVMCYSPDGEHEYLFDYYEMNGFGQGCFTTEKYFGITITHWQTLPEPPKGE